MKFALVNKIKVEAIKGSKGTCPNCGAEFIHKFGDREVHHWDIKETVIVTQVGTGNPVASFMETDLQQNQCGMKISDELLIADLLTENGFVIIFKHFPKL